MDDGKIAAALVVWRSALYPFLAGFPPATSDVSLVSSETADLRLVADAKGWDRLPTLPQLTRLWCFRIDERRLSAITRCRSLTRLYLEGVRTDLSSIEKLTHLEILSIESARGLTSLAELGMNPPLVGLSVTNAPRIASLAPLAARKDLRALNVSGGMWSRMTVDSLGPLAALQELEYLDLTNLAARDESLQPLASLERLKELHLPNFYAAREFAMLASRLRDTDCTWFRPVVHLPNTPCPNCGRMEVVIPTGKGSRRLCRSCDADRVRRHEERFRAWAG